MLSKHLQLCDRCYAQLITNSDQTEVTLPIRLLSDTAMIQ